MTPTTANVQVFNALLLILVIGLVVILAIMSRAMIDNRPRPAANPAPTPSEGTLIR